MNNEQDVHLLKLTTMPKILASFHGTSREELNGVRAITKMDTEDTVIKIENLNVEPLYFTNYGATYICI